MESDDSITPLERGFVIAAPTAVQAFMSFTNMMLAAIAPAVAAALGVPASLIGLQVSLVFGAAAALSPYAGLLVRRFGACRTSQMSLVLGILGSAMILLPHLAFLALASLMIGSGYALTNPSASHLLSRFAAGKHRNLVFSIKQMGVPVGGALAGLIGPRLTLAFGWHAVPITAGLILVTLLALLQIRRHRWDDDRDRTATLGGNPWRGLGLIWKLPPVRGYAATSFFYTISQLCLMAFLVTLLVEEAHMSLVEAGTILFLVHSASAVGRLFWGVVADRLGDSGAVLITVGIGTAVCAFLSSTISPEWPTVGLTALFVVFGICAIGWNGVFMAEVARLSPAGNVGVVTGAVLTLTFGGVLIGPSSLTAMHEAIGSYSSSFGLLTGVALIGATFAFIARKAARRQTKD